MSEIHAILKERLDREREADARRKQQEAQTIKVRGKWGKRFLKGYVKASRFIATKLHDDAEWQRAFPVHGNSMFWANTQLGHKPDYFETTPWSEMAKATAKKKAFQHVKQHAIDRFFRR